MWSSGNTAVQKETITKKRVNICVDKNLYERFKVVADKDMRKYSNILEGAMRRYVQSKIWNLLVFVLSIIFVNFIEYNIF